MSHTIQTPNLNGFYNGSLANTLRLNDSRLIGMTFRYLFTSKIIFIYFYGEISGLFEMNPKV